MKDNPILITGIPRSGTSMTAGVIHLCGAWGGEMSGPNNHNQKGMFENTQLRNEVIKPYLRSIKCDPKGQFPLPDIDRYRGLKKEFVDEWQNKVMSVVESQTDPKHGKWDENKRWFYKAPKMCLMWPIWAEAFPNAKWLIVRRDDRDIVESCMRTSFMSYYQYREGWYKWISEHKDRFTEMSFAGLDIKFIWPEQMVLGNFREMECVIDWLGLDWDYKKAKEFIAPELWKWKWKKIKKQNIEMEAKRYGHKSN